MLHLGRHVRHQEIGDGNSRHGFYNDNGSRDDNGVMPPGDDKGCILAIVCDGLLRLGDGGSGFDSCPKHERASIT